jgi:hypothetical protein
MAFTKNLSYILASASTELNCVQPSLCTQEDESNTFCEANHQNAQNGTRRGQRVEFEDPTRLRHAHAATPLGPAASIDQVRADLQVLYKIKDHFIAKPENMERISEYSTNPAKHMQFVNYTHACSQSSNTTPKCCSIVISENTCILAEFMLLQVQY